MLNKNKIAARFFFKNCCVSFNVDGKMSISRKLNPSTGDVVLNRNFIHEEDLTLIFNKSNEFFTFISNTSSTCEAARMKYNAIGYMLCNKLPRGGMRCMGFVCVNEDNDASRNGKSLFARGIAEMSNCRYGLTKYFDPENPFLLESVAEDTNVFVLEDYPLHRYPLQRIYNLCTSAWIVNRKARPAFAIPLERVPYLLITTSAQLNVANPALHRRFAVLEFSSFFDDTNIPSKLFGHWLFNEWDDNQWHLFDNFMFYCVRDYLEAYKNMRNPFRR